MSTSPSTAGVPHGPAARQEALTPGSEGRPVDAGPPPTLRKAAHDVRGSLGTIVLNVELLRLSLSNEDLEAQKPGQEHSLAVIASEVQRITEMVDSLFGDLGTLSEPGEAYDLREALSGLVTKLSPYCGRRGVEPRLQLPEQACPVRIGRDAVQEALVSLLLHAVEAMPGGGELDVSLRSTGATGIVSIAGPRFGAQDPLPDSSAVQRITEQTGAAVRISQGARPAIEIELPLEPTPS